MTSRFVGIFVVIVAGCGGETDKPGFIAPCQGADCVGQARSEGVPPDSGTAGAAGAGGQATTSLSGIVLIYNDGAFETASPFEGTAQIEAEGAAGDRVAAEFDGATPYQMDGVRVSESNWISVSPQLGRDAVPTLQPVPTNRETNGDLILVRESSLELIFSLVVTPVARDPAAASVVVFITDTRGAPRSNVELVVESSELIAYEDAGVWSDLVAATGPRGLAMAGNIAAAELPGTTITLGFTGSAQGSVPVRVAQGAVTVLQAAF